MSDEKFMRLNKLITNKKAPRLNHREAFCFLQIVIKP